MVIGLYFSKPAAPQGYIEGGATILKVPARLIIDLFDRTTRTWIRSTIASATGRYRFDGLATATKYDIVGRDPAGVRADEIRGARQPRPY